MTLTVNLLFLTQYCKIAGEKTVQKLPLCYTCDIEELSILTVKISEMAKLMGTYAIFELSSSSNYYIILSCF